MELVARFFFGVARAKFITPKTPKKFSRFHSPTLSSCDIRLVHVYTQEAIDRTREREEGKRNRDRAYKTHEIPYNTNWNLWTHCTLCRELTQCKISSFISFRSIPFVRSFVHSFFSSHRTHIFHIDLRRFKHN